MSAAEAEIIIMNELKKRAKIFLPAPTYERLREITGIKVDSYIAKILDRLESKGLIERRSNYARGIILKEAA